MSFIGSALGLGGQSANPNQGAAGVNYQAQGTNVAQPTTVDQANQTYTQAQSGLAQQQAFLNALQAQNGVGNQASVFNQQQAIANGQGPNPAQTMLAQATGQNVAQQGALMASQRGAGANPALLARQAAQQGAATQQNAAGQAATLQANQSLGALNQLGGIAQNQVANQAGANSSYNQAAQSEQQNILNSLQGQNNSNVAMQSNVNNANAGLAGVVAKNQNNTVGGLLGGVASGLGPLSSFIGGGKKPGGGDTSGASGGGIQQGQNSSAPYAEGGPVMEQQAQQDPNGPMSGAGRFLFGSAPMNQMSQQPQQAEQLQMDSSPPADNSTPAQGIQGMAMKLAPLMAARGGKVPALVSPGERYLPPHEVDKVAKGEKSPLKAGEKIPGKPKVAGSKNSYANDTVPKTLEEGGIVLPRSVTQAKDPAKAAHAFVSAIINKQKRR